MSACDHNAGESLHWHATGEQINNKNAWGSWGRKASLIRGFDRDFASSGILLKHPSLQAHLQRLPGHPGDMLWVIWNEVLVD